MSYNKDTLTINNIGVTAIIKEGVIDQAEDKITMILQNNTDKQYYYGLEFKLERESNGVWVKVPFKEELVFIQIALLLGEHETKEEIINLNYFNKLEPGKYRVVKNFSGEGEALVVTGEFEVVSEL